MVAKRSDPAGSVQAMAPSASARDLARWAESLAAIARTGLGFTQSLYERERFEEILTVAADIRAEVDGDPDGEIADRDERQPRQERNPHRADRLGPHHRRLPVPPVHEDPGDRPDQGNRGTRGDQDSADRGRSPRGAARENLRHPEH